MSNAQRTLPLSHRSAWVSWAATVVVEVEAVYLPGGDAKRLKPYMLFRQARSGPS